MGAGAADYSGSPRVSERDAQYCVADPHHQPLRDFHQREGLSREERKTEKRRKGRRDTTEKNGLG